MGLERIYNKMRVIVTCGAGGVGKTTTAASIACHAAGNGRKVAVLTVDPARRLASSLGLESFKEDVKQVEIPAFGEANGGSLDAMMLDTSSTYDRLVKRYAPSTDHAKRILNNKFYRHFSGAVGGSHEYTAMERLYELVEAGKWDLLVLDTPPTIHALDFLDAPQRLIDAFDESIFKWIIKPYLMAGKVGVQVLSFGGAYIFKTLTRFVGGEMIEELSEFLLLFQDMFEGFRERAFAVQSLLKARDTSFVVITTPQANALQEASLFCRELGRMDLPFGGFIVNRAFPPLENEIDRESAVGKISGHKSARDALSEEFLDRFFAAKNNYLAAVKHQRDNLRRYIDPIRSDAALYLVPLFDGDVADIPSLLGFAESVRNEESP